MDRVKAVGHVGEQKRRIVLQKGLEGVGQDLVGAVADEHLLGRGIVAGRDRLAQARGARIGIEARDAPPRCERHEHARDEADRDSRWWSSLTMPSCFGCSPGA